MATPQTQPRQSIGMAMPTARTPINIRSMPLVATTPQMNSLTPIRSMYGVQSPNFNVRHPQQPTPFPVINQNQKGLFEKIVDYLINDGPSTRYGMICKECHGHNGKYTSKLKLTSKNIIKEKLKLLFLVVGMVSQEEYEYSAFKCAFCKALNPAKKLRPIAPRLPLAINPTTVDASSKPTTAVGRILRPEEPSSSTSVSDKESGRYNFILEF